MGTSNVSWLPITSSPYVMVPNYGYTTSLGTQTLLALPDSAAYGDVIEISGQGLAGWRVTQGAGQYIQYGAVTTTVGVTGYLESGTAQDSVKLLCIATNLGWKVLLPNTATLIPV